MKSFYSLIKFVVDTKNHGLVMEPNQPTENNVWKMMAYCDSDYAGDNGTQSTYRKQCVENDGLL